MLKLRTVSLKTGRAVCDTIHDFFAAVLISNSDGLRVKKPLSDAYKGRARVH